MTRLSLEQVASLLGEPNLPGTPDDLRDLVRYTENLVDRYGEEWIRQNRVRLLAEWDYILSM